MDEITLNRIGHRLDSAATLDIRSRGGICPIMETLYPFAREKYKKPLSIYAAEKLKSALQPGDCVFIVTGLACFGLALETDGPPGAVALGRSLQLGLGVNPVFITHDMFSKMIEKSVVSAGFMNVSPDTRKESWDILPSAAIVEGFPVDQTEAEVRAEILFNTYKPNAIIAIEARGANSEGEYHVVDGTNITAKEAKLVELFKIAAKKNILSIGILDGCGHEIGFGELSEPIKNLNTRYTTCSCGCPDGMHDSTYVDIAFPAAVSNWGAYAVCAGLAATLNNTDVLHDSEFESRVVRACADSGAMDGLSGRSEYSVDGLPENIQLSIVNIMRQIIISGLKGYTPAIK